MRYKNKYRIPSARAPWRDYAANGAYFVTIITKNRHHWFGKVANGTMELSPVGQIADACWLEIPEHFAFVKLGAHIIMPDHVHGIITIDKPDQDKNPVKLNKFGPQSQNLASVIRGFKAGVSKYARITHPEFAWLPRFHDSIIKDEEAFRKISQYIKNNPANWNKKR